MKTYAKAIEDHNANVKRVASNYSSRFNAATGLYYVIRCVMDSKPCRWLAGLFRKEYATKNSVHSVVTSFVDYIKIGVKYALTSLDWITSKAVMSFGSGKGFGISELVVPYISTIESMKNPMNWISMPIGYKASLAAGNFATMYGYGAAQISYFDKMKSNQKIKYVRHFIKRHPWLGIIGDIVLMPSRILSSVFNTSPSGISSCMDQIKMLETELSKQDLSPEMRSKITADIEKCKLSLSKLIDISKREKDPDIMKKLYNKFLFECLDGIGLKDALLNNADRFTDWDNAMTAKMNRGEIE